MVPAPMIPTVLIGDWKSEIGDWRLLIVDLLIKTRYFEDAVFILETKIELS